MLLMIVFQNISIEDTFLKRGETPNAPESGVREKCYKLYKRTKTDIDKIKWKKARALASKPFNLTKKKELQQFLSTMTVNTHMSKIYEKIRKIRGKTPRNIKILTFDNRIYSTLQDIVNLLAEIFSRVSSKTNYSDRFRQHKEVEERTNLDFSFDNTEEYNALFSMRELQHALSSCGNTGPGPDRILYLMLKNLAPNAQIFYCICITQCEYNPSSPTNGAMQLLFQSLNPRKITQTPATIDP